MAHTLTPEADLLHELRDSIKQLEPHLTVHLQQNNQIWFHLPSRVNPSLAILNATIHHSLHTTTIQQTIYKREELTQPQTAIIDWPAQERAFSYGLCCHWINFTKLSHKLLITNHLNNHFYGMAHICPSFLQPGETPTHIPMCPVPTIRDFQLQQPGSHWYLHVCSILAFQELAI